MQRGFVVFLMTPHSARRPDGYCLNELAFALSRRIPIVPVMLGDAHLAGGFAARMMEKGVYVTAFSFPVVPRGQARIRTQMSAAHSEDDLSAAIAAFIETGRELKVIA